MYTGLYLSALHDCLAHLCISTLRAWNVSLGGEAYLIIIVETGNEEYLTVG